MRVPFLFTLALTGCIDKSLDDIVPPTPDFPPAPCTPRLETVSSRHFGSTYYASSSSMEECVCEWVVTDASSINPGTPVVWVTGADPRQDAALVGWESSVNTRSSNHDAGRDDYYFVHSAFASSTYEPVAGSYAVYLPAVDASGAAITDCGSHYGTVEWEIPDDDDAAPSRVPPRRLPGGLLEDAIACVPGQMVTAEFSLEGSPDAPTLIPLQRSGPPRFGGIDVRTVELLDPAGAASITLHGTAGDARILTPAAPVTHLPPGEAWLASARWMKEEPQPNGAAARVRITGSCPTQPLAPLDVAQSYVVDNAIVPFQGQQRYLLRVQPAGTGSALTVEVEGVAHVAASAPLTPVGPERWRVDAEDGTFAMHGFVERTPQGGLLLDLEAARYFDDELGAVQVEARAYP